MSSVQLSIPCFHDSRYYDNNVSYCKLITHTDSRKYHVVHLKDHVHYDTLQQFASVHHHFTKHDHIDELWEEVSSIPLNTLYAIDKRSDVLFVLDLASQLLQYFCLITQQDLYYQNLTKEISCVTFLQSNASFTFDEDCKPRYLLLNRFQIKNANLLVANQKKRKLLLQIFSVPMIIKLLFFTKNKKSTQKTIIQCSEHNCKLLNYTPRFLGLNENFELMQNFHEVFCRMLTNTTKIESFESLHLLFPQERTAITETINYLHQM